VGDAFQDLRAAVETHIDAQLRGWNEHPFFLYDGKGAPEVVHLTIKREAHLILFGNKFLTGEQIEPQELADQILQFLFFVSADFDPYGTPKQCDKARRRWMRKHKRIDLAKAVEGILQYLASEYADAPGRSWKPKGYKEDQPKTEPTEKEIWAMLKQPRPGAVWARFMFENYGMKANEVHNLPLPQLYQYYWAAISSRPRSEGQGAPSVADPYISGALWLKNRKQDK
jgi:hypothetical protein